MTTVKTQAELDKALAEHAAEIIIDSPTGVWLTITDSGSSRVEAWGSSRVVARGSSRVVARGSSRVVARGSSRVVAWGSSRVEAWESSRVEASKYVAVHLHSQRVTMTGTGHVIDMTAVDPQTLTDWLALSGAKTVDGKLRVYKAVDAPGRASRIRSVSTSPTRSGEMATNAAAACDTFAANGNHHALVVRNNSSKGDGGEMVTPVTEVLRTLTTTGHQSLLVPYRSNSTAHLASDPLPTLSTVDPAAIASMETRIDDCMFRMLEPREIAAGMAFPATYIIKGNRREQVRQAGNAVTPPAARDLIAAVAESLGAA
jgi:site-specific DNA-cytosine methylase